MMYSEHTYHENIRNRLAAEGWRVAVLYPALRAGMGWTAFLVILCVISSIPRAAPMRACIMALVLGAIFGLLHFIADAASGRELIVSQSAYVAMKKLGRTRVSEPLTQVRNVEIVENSSSQLTIQISFRQPVSCSFVFAVLPRVFSSVQNTRVGSPSKGALVSGS